MTGFHHSLLLSLWQELELSLVPIPLITDGIQQNYIITLWVFCEYDLNQKTYYGTKGKRSLNMKVRDILFCAFVYVIKSKIKSVSLSNITTFILSFIL
jgi:hypothetical protein